MKMNDLNRFSILVILGVVSSFSFAGCEAIGDIFKAGIWVGVIVVVGIVAVIGFVMMLFKK
jgi:hypothetical protein